MPKQNLGKSFTGGGSKPGSKVKKMNSAPAGIFKPGSPGPVKAYHKAIESQAERKDRILGD